MFEERGFRSSRDNGEDALARGAFRRRRSCRFCTEKDATIDYKDAEFIRGFITERGKIVSRRMTGNCAKHQRAVARAVRRARLICLVPFVVTSA